MRPAEARAKPKVSAFINARYDKIEALQPDLILAFSDLQADIAAELIRRGYTVVTFNQRSIAEILQMVRMVGALVGCADRAAALADTFERGLDDVRARAARLSAPAARVFRRMGCAADLRYPMGRGTRRDRGRPAALSRVTRTRPREKSHRRSRCRCRA